MNEISLPSLVTAIRKKIWLIIVCALLGFSIGFGYVKCFAKPVYAASAKLCASSGTFLSENDVLISQGASYITTAEVQVTFALMKSFVTILQESSDIYEQTLAETGLADKYSVTQLMNMTSISSEEDTLIINITIRANNANDCKALTDKFAELAPSGIMNRVSRTDVTLLSDANTKGVVQIAPKSSIIKLETTFAGICLALFIIIIQLIKDKTVKSEDDFTSRFDLPLLGTIPDFETYDFKKKRNKYYE